ncbi:MAG: hypothetical protein HY319_02880, partial [Armatimonadetes bacterium]|nr:hypothetical protein [Armatimonadota bacterium]
FMILHLNGSAMTQWARDNTDRRAPIPAALKQEALPLYYVNAGPDVPRPDPRSLLVVESEVHARMYGQRRMDQEALDALSGTPDIRLEELSEGGDPQWKERATDVYPTGVVQVSEGVDSHGHKVVTVEVPDGAKPIRTVAFVRAVDGKDIALFVIDQANFETVYDGYKSRYGRDPQTLPPGEFLRVANAELYQSFNPFFVIAFTPLVVWFFGGIGAGITTARKVFLGLALTTVSLLVMALAGWLSDNGAVKVDGMWLVGFYAIVTFGELCLSPMGLSLVTKLSPKRLVGLTMGGWFMATAFGNNLSGFFGGIQSSLEPASFFLVLAGMAALAAGFIFALLPKLDQALKQYGA